MSVVNPLKFSTFSDDEISTLFAPLKALPTLAVGVSGGPDSMALMLMLVRWRSIIGENAPEIIVMSVDHGLRREATEEVKLVAGIARKFGLKYQGFTWSGLEAEGNVSANSRDARYDLMCGWCAHKQISHLLVAHTLDDQAETVLLRLARGSGVDGLSAMAVSRFWNATVIYRPLLNVKRSRLRQLLEQASCPYVEDPSNHDLKYDRVRLRQALAILEPLGISAEGLAETAGRLAQAREALDEMARQAIDQAVVVDDAGYCVLSPQKLAPYAYEIKRRVLGRLLRAIAGRPYAPQQSLLDGLLAWVSTPDTSSRTLGGCLFMVRHGDVWVMRERGRKSLPELLLKPGQSELWDNRFDVSLSAASDAPLVVKALGVEKYAGLKAVEDNIVHYPSSLAAGLPSFWQGPELIAVPHLNYYLAESVCQIEAHFANSGLLSAD